MVISVDWQRDASCDQQFHSHMPSRAKEDWTPTTYAHHLIFGALLHVKKPLSTLPTRVESDATVAQD
jgi:hypothetical protein